MGSHVSRWYRQLFELSLNGFRRLCKGTNGPESKGTALPLLERQAIGPGAATASLSPSSLHPPPAPPRIAYSLHVLRTQN